MQTVENLKHIGYKETCTLSQGTKVLQQAPASSSLMFSQLPFLLNSSGFWFLPEAEEKEKSLSAKLFQFSHTSEISQLTNLGIGSVCVCVCLHARACTQVREVEREGGGSG